MPHLKSIAPWGVVVIPMLTSILALAVMATLPGFCQSLDPNLHSIMDGIGGELLRSVFYRCDYP